MKNLVIDHHKFIVGQRLVAMLARKTVRVIYMSCAKGQASTGNLLLTLSTDTTGGIGPCGSHGWTRAGRRRCRYHYVWFGRTTQLVQIICIFWWHVWRCGVENRACADIELFQPIDAIQIAGGVSTKTVINCMGNRTTFEWESNRSFTGTSSGLPWCSLRNDATYGL